MQFKLLLRELHPESYSKTQALQYLVHYADFQDEKTRDKMITLHRFAEMAVELKLFPNVKQAGEGY
jgi:hypothetical protein